MKKSSSFLHQKAKSVAKKYLKAESELFEIILEVSIRKKPLSPFGGVQLPL